MNRETMMEHLAHAGQQLALSQACVDRQRQIVISLEAHGYDPTHAKRVLRRLEEKQLVDLGICRRLHAISIRI
jgi:hypothetical protein